MLSTNFNNTATMQTYFPKVFTEYYDAVLRRLNAQRKSLDSFQVDFNKKRFKYTHRAINIWLKSDTMENTKLGSFVKFSWTMYNDLIMSKPQNFQNILFIWNKKKQKILFGESYESLSLISTVYLSSYYYVSNYSRGSVKFYVLIAEKLYLNSININFM